MDLPSYIRDFLQTNYYIPAEQLDLPFDRMPASLRELIMSKCLNPSENGGFEAKSAEEVLDKVREQFADDINSDVTKSPERQLDNFVAHHKTFAALIAAAEKNEKNPSDFDRVAILTAAKRMAADEYADTPKTLSNFLKIKEETAAELRVKYYTARYFDAHGQNGNEADGAYHERALSDIAEISRMVREGKTDEIAGRFNLPDTRADRDAAKGATLSFAMAELKNFSDRVEKRVKDSPFVKRVNGLNDSFKQKYPKSYMAAKLVGNTAAALSLGPAFSAFKAVAGINAMRKDYAKFKQEHPDKGGRFWNFISSADGRKKLLEISQNTVRVIPGMRAVGIALSAVKNSANLKTSLKDIKKNGVNKQTALRVGLAAAGLLAVSVTAAYANDEVAEMVNNCVSDTFGSVKDGVENVIETIHSSSAPVFNTSAQNFVPDMEQTMPADSTVLQSGSFNLGAGTSDNMEIDENGFTFTNVNASGTTNVVQNGDSFNETVTTNDGKFSVNGTIKTEIDPTKAGATVNHVHYDTENASATVVVTDNQSGNHAVLARDSSGERVGIRNSNDTAGVEVAHGSDGFNVKGTAERVKVGDNEIRNAGFDAGAQTAHGDIHHANGSHTAVNTNHSGATVMHQNGDTFNEAVMTRDGKFSMNGTIKTEIDPTKAGTTVNHVHYDTENASATVVVTDNQSGNHAVLARDSSGERVGLRNSNDTAGVEVSHGSDGFNVKGTAERVKVGSNEIRNAGFDAGAQTAHGDIHHADGSHTAVNTNHSGATVMHQNGDSFQEVTATRDGKVGLQGRIARAGQNGGRTTVDYDTRQESVKVSRTTESGRTVTVSRDKNEIRISSGNVAQSNVTVSVDRTGINVQGKNGRKVNISKIAKFLKGLTR